ncbi:C-type lectin-like protein [Penguinpox virus]|uniref:C-type lectin-like protein n=1 Tax=Penguinpox virus TaxID=648998 RepID=A0A068EHZ1_9POXV|nr:C-type lectin-like protein [Penguinpox virus]AID46983.1 C-type lectin-like protein [Penguinpox virus]
MALNLSIRPIERELGIKVLAAALDPLNSENDHTGDGGFIVRAIRNIEFYRPRYLCAVAGDTVKIYFLEGKGGLIYSVSEVGSPSTESGYVTEDNYVEFKTDSSCLITLTCTSSQNTVVYWME